MELVAEHPGRKKRGSFASVNAIREKAGPLHPATLEPRLPAVSARPVIIDPGDPVIGISLEMISRTGLHAIL